MGISASIRSRRRSAGQLHALATVQREILATDGNSRRKYLREFTEAFQRYQQVLSREQLEQRLLAADVLLVGDYHALPNSQQYFAQLIRDLAARSGRPVVVGIEMVFARDQHILDEWRRGEINEAEFRSRTRYELEWGYDWEPIGAMLNAARQHAAALYGLDCLPRNDLRKIAARDRHAAVKIAEIRQQHPEAVILVLFGESHLAPTHLPYALHLRMPGERVLTVLQNVDALYWQAAGERADRVEATLLDDDTVCVFNATPLEKYESYRLCIERWRQERRVSAPDLAPTVYNLINGLARFLYVDEYSPTNSTQPRFLVDLLPEVCFRPLARVAAVLRGRRAHLEEVGAALRRLHERGSCYLPRLRTLFVSRFEMEGCTEEVARFLHSVCRRDKATMYAATLTSDDCFYRAVMEEALACLGSRVLHPDRTPLRESDLYVFYSQQREQVEAASPFGYREHLQLVDFLVLHKEFELSHKHFVRPPELIAEGRSFTGEKLAFATRHLGRMLATQLYDAYVSGKISRRYLRSLYFKDLSSTGSAAAIYFQIVQRLKTRRTRLAA